MGDVGRQKMANSKVIFDFFVIHSGIKKFKYIM